MRDQPGFRFNTTAALLTYNGIQDLEQWHRFLKHIAKHKKEWQVLHWCASMEEGKSATRHIHFMVQFIAKVDRTSRSFSFEGIAPNCSPQGPSTDLCGEMLRGRYPQRSIDRGMYYVFAEKVGNSYERNGSPCFAGNYVPCWWPGTRAT